MDQTTYPLVLTDLADSACLVVGGGAVAERKVAGLLEAGARPYLVSPTLTPALQAWLVAGRIAHRQGRYCAEDLRGAALVFAATDDSAVNAEVAAEAQRRGLLVNVADAPASGSFHTVATLRRGDLLITVSTGGASPATAARIRAELAALYGPEHAAALATAAAERRHRAEVAQ